MIAYQKGACFSDLECLKFQHQSTINTSTLNQMITAGKLSLFNLIELPLSVAHLLDWEEGNNVSCSRLEQSTSI